MRPRAFALAFAPITLLVVACSSSDPATSSPAAASPAISVPTPTAAPPTPTTSPQTSSDSNAPGRIGGQAIDVGGGVSVAVGKPANYPASGSADNNINRRGDTLTIYPVTVTNDSGKPIDMVNTAVTAYASGEQVDPFADTSHPSDDHFTGTLMPGRTMKATFGFLTRVVDSGQMQVEVYVGGHGDAHGIFMDGDGTS